MKFWKNYVFLFIIMLFLAGCAMPGKIIGDRVVFDAFSKNFECDFLGGNWKIISNDVYSQKTLCYRYNDEDTYISIYIYRPT